MPLTSRQLDLRSILVIRGHLLFLFLHVLPLPPLEDARPRGLPLLQRPLAQLDFCLVNNLALIRFHQPVDTEAFFAELGGSLDKMRLDLLGVQEGRDADILTVSLGVGTGRVLVVVEESDWVPQVNTLLGFLLAEKALRHIRWPVDNFLEVLRRVLVREQIAEVNLEPFLFFVELGVKFEKLNQLWLGAHRLALIKRNNHVEEQEAADAASEAPVAVAHLEEVLQREDEVPQAGPLLLSLLADLGVATIDRAVARANIKIDSSDGILHLDDRHPSMLQHLDDTQTVFLFRAPLETVVGQVSAQPLQVDVTVRVEVVHPHVQVTAPGAEPAGIRPEDLQVESGVVRMQDSVAIAKLNVRVVQQTSRWFFDFFAFFVVFALRQLGEFLVLFHIVAAILQLVAHERDEVFAVGNVLRGERNVVLEEVSKVLMKTLKVA